MAGLKLTGLEQFKARLNQDKLRREAKITQGYRALVAAVFTDLVKYTPQYSGGLASSWSITFHNNTSMHIYRPPDIGWYMEDPYKMGDEPAVSTALSELGKLTALRWNSKVTLRNPLPYASQVQSGESSQGQPLRPVNTEAAYKGRIMLDMVSFKYKNLRYVKQALRAGGVKP